MLKNKRKPNIVSRLFDTINQLTEDETINDAIECVEVKNPINYIVAVPNKTLPFKFSSIKPFMICLYQVRTDGLYPFLLFLFQKEYNNLSFLSINCSTINEKKIRYEVKAYLKEIIPTILCSYAGFYETEENNIIIFSCDEPVITNLETNDSIWATPFEIINKKIPLYSFQKSVTDFFRFNTDFLILKTLNQSIYESPMIGYVPALSQSFEEVDIFRETILPALGKCYYLCNEISSPHKKMIRIAFFAGTMLIYPVKKEQNYDSLLCHEKKYYIIQNYNQHVILSI